MTYRTPPLPPRCINCADCQPAWNNSRRRLEGGYTATPPLDGCFESSVADYGSFKAYWHACEEGAGKQRKVKFYRFYMYREGADMVLTYFFGTGREVVDSKGEAAIAAQLQADKLRGLAVCDPVVEVLGE